MTTDATLKIPAIHCDACVKTVTKTLEALPGVRVSGVDTDTKIARLQFDASVTDLDGIREALDQVGFSAED